MKLQRIKIAFGMFGFMLLITACVLIVFLVLPKMDSALKVIASLWGGFILLSVIVYIIHKRLFKGHKALLNDQWGTALHALNQISRGDFAVLLPESDEHFNEMTRAINEMARSLGDIDKMRTDFISNVSHEIQSPLTNIGGFAELLKKDISEEERQRYAGIIEMESKRLSGLSDNLMKLSNLDNAKLNLGDFQIDKQIRNVVLAFEPQWSVKNITLELDLNKLMILADKEFLYQVWTNLLQNAIKFTHKNGYIHISLQNNIFKIFNTGDVIPAEDLIHIFERFYKVDKARDRTLGGNGLGLSIVKKILDLHGFLIQVDSVIEKGTTFMIEF